MSSFQVFDQIRRELVANSIHTTSADTTQLSRWVELAACIAPLYLQSSRRSTSRIIIIIIIIIIEFTTSRRVELHRQICSDS